MNKKPWKDCTIEERDSIKLEGTKIAREGGTEADIEEATGYKFAIFVSSVVGANGIDELNNSTYIVSRE